MALNGIVHFVSELIIPPSLKIPQPERRELQQTRSPTTDRPTASPTNATRGPTNERDNTPRPTIDGTRGPTTDDGGATRSPSSDTSSPTAPGETRSPTNSKADSVPIGTVMTMVVLVALSMSM